MKELSQFIDHTNLAATTNLDQIDTLCQEAIENNFFSVCVNSSYVKASKEILKESSVKVCTVIGFPLGAMSSKAKAYEAKIAIEDGADEIDMVINIGFVKSNRFELVKSDISEVLKECKNRVLKVILETALLEKDEIIKVCEICRDLKVGFVKTSTGFSTRGASIEDIKIMKDVVKDKVLIKASGGIRSREKAIQIIEAGASRLGTSSGIAIINNIKANKGY